MSHNTAVNHVPTLKALPFVPDLDKHPSFSMLFDPEWISDLKQRVGSFVSRAISRSGALSLSLSLSLLSNERARLLAEQYQISTLTLQLSPTLTVTFPPTLTLQVWPLFAAAAAVGAGQGEPRLSCRGT